MNKEQTNNITKKKNRKMLIIGLIVIVVVVALVAVFMCVSGSKDSKLKETLQLAENYLNELDYEKAIAAYEKAIKIDPKSADAYCGLADTYVAMAENSINEGNIDKANEYYDAAIKALDEGFNSVSDSDKERLETYKTKIESLKNKVAGETETTANSVQEEALDSNFEEINYEIPEEILNLNLFGKDWKTYNYDSLKAEMTKGLELRIDSNGLERYMYGDECVGGEYDNHDGYFLESGSYSIGIAKSGDSFYAYVIENAINKVDHRNINDYFDEFFGKNIYDIINVYDSELSVAAYNRFHNISEYTSLKLNDKQTIEAVPFEDTMFEDTMDYRFVENKKCIRFDTKDDIVYGIYFEYY